MKFEYNVLRVFSPFTDNVKGILEKEIERCNKMKTWFGELGRGQDPSLIRLSQTSHTLSNLRLDGSIIRGNIAFLSTPAGELAERFFKNDPSCLSLRAFANYELFNGPPELSFLEIITFDIAPQDSLLVKA